jgi:hypothetical protein
MTNYNRVVITQIGRGEFSVRTEQWVSDMEEWVELKGSYRDTRDLKLALAYAGGLAEKMVMPQ